MHGRSRLRLIALACGLGTVLAGCTVLSSPRHVGQALGLDDDAVHAILAHGPWPPAREPGPADGSPGARIDPSNRGSGDAQAVALGRRLFADPRLSSDGRIACASCHDAARAFTDGRPRAIGLGRHDRNTIGLLDTAGQRWYGWDGGTDSLWAASIRPILTAHEMNGSAASVAALVATDPALRDAHRRAFGEPGDDPQRVLADVGKALAAYLETLVSPRTPFDDFRDALAIGDLRAARRYPESARRGLALFVGRGRCTVCHAGPRFSNGEFHDVGRPFLVEPGRVDPGRHAGVRRVIADPFNQLGRHVDRPARAPQAGTARPSQDDTVGLATRTVRLEHRNWGEWKTPSLRSLRHTAPYMHDGSLATLPEVVRHYAELDPDRLHADGESLLRPLGLTDAERADLVAFLESLGD
jgi:cytochrome c peroxidase